MVMYMANSDQFPALAQHLLHLDLLALRNCTRPPHRTIAKILSAGSGIMRKLQVLSSIYYGQTRQDGRRGRRSSQSKN